MFLRLREGSRKPSLWDPWLLFALHLKMGRMKQPKSGHLIWEDRKFPKLKSQP